MSIKHSKKFSFRLEKYNNNYSVYNYKKISQSENFKVSSKSRIWLIFYSLDSTHFGFFCWFLLRYAWKLNWYLLCYCLVWYFLCWKNEPFPAETNCADMISGVNIISEKWSEQHASAASTNWVGSPGGALSNLRGILGSTAS